MTPDTSISPDYAIVARSGVARMIKARARRYGRRPQALEALYPGLGSANPGTLVAIAASLVEREARDPRRWFGFGGEVNLINARAALLLGRALRRHGRATTSIVSRRAAGRNGRADQAEP